MHGEKLRQFSLSPLEWVAREDVLKAYDLCLAGHELGRWPELGKSDGTSTLTWETLAEETFA